MLDVEDWAEIRRLHRAERVSISEIARVMGISRNTVKAALRSDGPPKYERAQVGRVGRCVRAADQGVVAVGADDAGDGDRRADRVAARDPDVESAGGRAAPVLSAAGPGGQDGV